MAAILSCEPGRSVPRWGRSGGPAVSRSRRSRGARARAEPRSWVSARTPPGPAPWAWPLWEPLGPGAAAFTDPFPGGGSEPGHAGVLAGPRGDGGGGVAAGPGPAAAILPGSSREGAPAARSPLPPLGPASREFLARRGVWPAWPLPPAPAAARGRRPMGGTVGSRLSPAASAPGPARRPGSLRQPPRRSGAGAGEGSAGRSEREPRLGSPLMRPRGRDPKAAERGGDTSKENDAGTHA